MIFIVAGLLLLWVGTVTLRGFLRANPAAVARRMKQGGGAAALVAALLMLARGRIDLAFGLAGVGFWLTTGQKAPDWSRFARGARRARSRTSRVRSATIEMELDHDSGAMRGAVLDGPFAGRTLGELDQAQLQALYGSCLAGDSEGARLLEAYLDRRFAGWRQAGQGQSDAGSGRRTGERRPRGSGMSEEEAYELLGLAKGASREDVARAHRGMMKRFHPDHGGSTDVAARVNEAKDVLMRRHL